MQSHTIALMVSSVLMFGCSDHVTDIYVDAELGAIYGYVSPVDSGIVSAIGRQTVHADIAADGTFRLPDLEPDVYTIVFDPAHHSRREFSRVIVGRSDVILGRVSLSTLPFPIHGIAPEDGQDSVAVRSTLPALELHSDRQLDLDDLSGSVRIEPPIGGVWRAYARPHGQFRYLLGHRSDLQIGKTYSVRIPASVRTREGAPIGADITWQFGTVPLAAAIELPRDDALPGVSFEHFTVEVDFHACIVIDSFLAAVSFDPPIPGAWLPGSSYLWCKTEPGRAERFRFVPESLPLPAHTDYALTISDRIPLYDDVTLLSPTSRRISTEPFGAIRVFPDDGAIDFHPRRNLELVFNTAMDTVSVVDAFELSIAGGESWGGERFWWPGHRTMAFKPVPDLQSGRLYRIALSRAARTALGENLTQELESFFTVE